MKLQAFKCMQTGNLETGRTEVIIAAKLIKIKGRGNHKLRRQISINLRINY